MRCIETVGLARSGLKATNPDPRSRPVSVIKETALESPVIRATAKAASAELRLRTLNTVKMV